MLTDCVVFPAPYMLIPKDARAVTAAVTMAGIPPIATNKPPPAVAPDPPLMAVVNTPVALAVSRRPFVMEVM